MKFLAKVLTLFLLFFGFFVKLTFAGGEFLVDSKVEYGVSESGRTLVTHEISLENAFSTLYATSYTLSLENIDAQNISAKYGNGTTLQVETQKNDNKTNIKIIFPDPVVGKGKVRHFFVSYENSAFAVRTGEVWEISIPKLSNGGSFRNYQVVLKVPVNLGLEAYISPRADSSEIQGAFRVYTFDKDSVLKTGVTAGFGEFQVFVYTLNYHLENPLGRSAETEIALPPDTAFQKIHIKSISPEPTSVRIDEDGNWLALYKLKARERVDVVASGEVQIFSSFRPYPVPTAEVLSANLKETTFWQVNDPKIKALAQELKTPRAIYDYVSSTLKYDYERVRPNVERLGSLGALGNKNSAICMEFTDLFIAIARAAGIPAREINGYAYTENPEIQPLSLVADVLHSWPEYWDDSAKAWIPVDPTWASTTGGINFFDKLDLRHFAFVIHGIEDSKPYAPGSYKLGPNPQKDVFVSFGKLSESSTNYPHISATFKQGFPFLGSKLSLKVENKGTQAFYSLYPLIYFDEKETYRDYIEVLPPFSSHETEFSVPYSFLGKDTPDKIRVIVDGSDVEVPTNKGRVIITSLLALFLVFILIVVIILLRTKKWSLNYVKSAIKTAKDKFKGIGKKGSS